MYAKPICDALAKLRRAIALTYYDLISDRIRSAYPAVEIGGRMWSHDTASEHNPDRATATLSDGDDEAARAGLAEVLRETVLARSSA